MTPSIAIKTRLPENADASLATGAPWQMFGGSATVAYCRVHSVQTRRRQRERFAVLVKTANAQAATMTLAPGTSGNEGSANEHAWAEQWLYVVSGRGSARVARRTIALREGSLLVIQKREPHIIRAAPRSRLVTFNIYVPPAYDEQGEPLA
jgi:mannose-6-phosphate isomerase-like protein (cupin superfamily)